MTRELSIHGDLPHIRDLLRLSLAHFAKYLRGLGYERCEVVFGWAWGMEYPPGDPWKAFDIPLAELESEVHKPEDAGYGELGGDDVTFRVPPLACEFLFCHHGGIHVSFGEPSPVTEAIRRWSAAGFEVTEREIQMGS